MSKGIIDILYNPGSVSTPGTGTQTEAFTDTVTCYDDKASQLSFNEMDSELLSNLEELVQAGNEATVRQALIAFKQKLIFGSSLEIRPTILREFNNYLFQASQRFPQSPDIFQSSLEIILEFKHQMDKQAQMLGHLSQIEWVELERSLYSLTVWEEGLEQKQGFSFLSP